MQNVKNEHTDKTDVSYLQTVSRALKVLNLFETETALSLAAISSRLGVSKTIAYRLAHTLVLDGFLIQDSATKQYMLGDQVLLLGFCAVQRQAVKRIAHDLIWDFHERTKFSTYITIPCANQSLCVDRVVSDNTGRLSTIFVGGVYPLYAVPLTGSCWPFKRNDSGRTICGTWIFRKTKSSSFSRTWKKRVRVVMTALIIPGQRDCSQLGFPFMTLQTSWWGAEHGSCG